MFPKLFSSLRSEAFVRCAALVVMALAMTSAMLAQPSINTGGIVNVSGYLPTLAPNVVFAVFGQNLGPASIVIAPAPNYPASLAGTSLTFTPGGGGAAIVPTLVYTESIAVAAVLPSTIAPGTYAVRVTYQNQTSAPQNVTVAARAFDIATANGIGTGTAQATIGTVNGGYSLTRFTSSPSAPVPGNFTNTPAHALDIISLWGTGGGADLANDTGGSSGDQTAAGNFQVILSGQSITPAYAGSVAGYPGLWVVVFTVPAGIPPNCFTPLQVRSNGQLSNTATLPIAATGQTSCSAAGFSQSTLANLDAGGTVTLSGLTIGKVFSYTNGVATEIDEVGGPLSRFSAAEWLIPFSGPQVGPCLVLDQTYPAGGKEPSAADAYLNAGASLALTGPGVPAGGNVTPVMAPNGPVYINKPPGLSLVNGGAYTISGSGGTQVGPFTATATIPTSFAVSNLSSLTAINRSQPLTINWTGTGFDQILILLESGALTATTSHGVSVSCAVPAGPGTYTVPAAALAYLLPTTGPGGIGQLVVSTATANGGIYTGESTSGLTISVPLVGGGQIDFGGFAAFLGIIQSATIQ